QQLLALLGGRLLADLEAELAARPAEHAQHRRLDVLLADLVDARRVERGALAQQRLERNALRGRLLPEPGQLGRLERTRFREQLAQVGGPVLREGAADQAAAEHDAPLAPARADPQDPGLPRQADDLEDLAE